MPGSKEASQIDQKEEAAEAAALAQEEINHTITEPCK